MQMKKLKKKHTKTNNQISEYYYLFGILPMLWVLTLPFTFVLALKTRFSVLFIDFIVIMQVLTVIYMIYDIKAGGYSIKQIYNEHKKTHKGFRHILIPVQTIIYILSDAAAIIFLFINKH